MGPATVCRGLRRARRPQPRAGRAPAVANLQEVTGAARWRGCGSRIIIRARRACPFPVSSRSRLATDTLAFL